ncbi:MAG: DsrE family protein [Chitinophagaceae bacterium]|nr:DsrE family protein [Chitinophagaceae bacterium]
MPEAQNLRVVIQLSDDQVGVQKAVIGQIANLRDALNEIKIELVIHSRGIGIVLKDSKWQHHLRKIVEDRVAILVCRNTMDAHNFSPADLLDFVKVIPSAVAHLVVRQSEGWSYLKAGF